MAPCHAPFAWRRPIDRIKATRHEQSLPIPFHHHDREDLTFERGLAVCFSAPSCTREAVKKRMRALPALL